LQLSTNGFQSCLPIDANGAAASNNDQTYTLSTLSPIPGGAVLRVKVTSAVTDLAGVGLAADFVSPLGLTTSQALAVFATTPADGSTLAALSTPIAVEFNRPALGSSITVNTLD